MIIELKKILKDLLTENDNSTYCTIRVLSVCLSFPTILLFIWGCIQQAWSGHIDLGAMATAFTTMAGGFTALGAGVAVKSFTETR